MEAVESERIHESCIQDSHWVRGHGIHRLLCETNFHPHQQHYRRIVIKISGRPWRIDRSQVVSRIHGYHHIAVVLIGKCNYYVC
ncbi:unnamed protein product [Closterium sp. Naga37s-1]|nr:unnamed protein product [Closterium sp. Naga37s-1]